MNDVDNVGKYEEGRAMWLENIGTVLWHTHLVVSELSYDGNMLVRIADVDNDRDMDLLVYEQKDQYA